MSLLLDAVRHDDANLESYPGGITAEKTQWISVVAITTSDDGELEGGDGLTNDVKPMWPS